MTEHERRARTEEERRYYALNAKAWRINSTSSNSVT